MAGLIRAADIQKMLETLLNNDPEIEGVSLVTSDGLVVASMFREGEINEDELGAMSAALTGIAERVVEDFIRAVSDVEKVAVGVKIPEGMREILKEMKFRKLKVKLKRFKVGVQDQRGKRLVPSSESFAIVSESPEEFSDLTSGQIYSPKLNRFQRASVVNLIKRGALKKFSTTPSTDGLPTFIPGNEIYYASSPLSLYDILDSVYPVVGDREFVLILSYDDREPDLEGLDKLYYEEVTSKILKSPREILKHLQDPGEII